MTDRVQPPRRHQPRVLDLAPQVVDVLDRQGPARRRERDLLGQPPHALARTWPLGQHHPIAPLCAEPGGGLQVVPQRPQVLGPCDLAGDVPAAHQVVEQRRQAREPQLPAQPDLPRPRQLHEPTSARSSVASFCRRNASIASGAAIPAAASAITVSSARW
jgi:hypothetical protein